MQIIIAVMRPLLFRTAEVIDVYMEEVLYRLNYKWNEFYVHRGLSEPTFILIELYFDRIISVTNLVWKGFELDQWVSTRSILAIEFMCTESYLNRLLSGPIQFCTDFDLDRVFFMFNFNLPKFYLDLICCAQNLIITGLILYRV